MHTKVKVCENNHYNSTCMRTDCWRTNISIFLFFGRKKIRLPNTQASWQELEHAFVPTCMFQTRTYLTKVRQLQAKPEWRASGALDGIPVVVTLGERKCNRWFVSICNCMRSHTCALVFNPFRQPPTHGQVTNYQLLPPVADCQRLLQITPRRGAAGGRGGLLGEV